MPKSAITISLVEEARGGPFVLWDDLETSCKTAKELGFDAVELFLPGPDAVAPEQLNDILLSNDLELAAVGTGAGWVKHKLQLCDPDAEKRQQAIAFIKKMIEFGGPFEAPAIIGSMQGRFGGDVDKETAFGYLRTALNELGAFAATHDVPLIYEPLNRYETNLINTVADGVQFLETLNTPNVRLLADLFHMNIEEANIAEALIQGDLHIGHIHFVDSNRQATGFAHMNFEPIVDAIKRMGYEGYLSAEAFPLPDPLAAAKQTIEFYNQHFE